jgi:N utilization substance protein B
MAVAPQKLREATFQMLYSYDMSHTSDDAIVELLSHELTLPKSVLRTVQQRIMDIRGHLKEIDALIAQTSRSYDFERIQTVEKNILRLGIFELLHDSSVPQKVVFAECMRLATKFGTKESAAFINAILDAIVKKREGTAVNSDEIDKIANEMEENEKEIKRVIDTMDIAPSKKDPDNIHE